MKIITDTVALIPPSQGEDFGLTVLSVGVAINDRTYRDYADISSVEFLELIRQGGVPSSSQPAIGDILDVLDSTDEELLFITVGDGLSGSYQTAVGADHLISICHAGAPQRAQQVKVRFASSDTEILELSPGLTTHGGPGCIVIQAICK